MEKITRKDQLEDKEIIEQFNTAYAQIIPKEHPVKILKPVYKIFESIPIGDILLLKYSDKEIQFKRTK